MRAFSFIDDSTLRVSVEEKGVNLLRKMIQSSTNGDIDLAASSSPVVLVSTAFGNGSFQLSACTSYLGKQPKVDEVSAYMTETVTAAEREMLQSNDGVVDYCLSTKGSFPALYKVALRILVTPASTASSERDFSLLKIAVSKHKCNLKDDIIKEKAVLQSYFSNIYESKIE